MRRIDRGRAGTASADSRHGRISEDSLAAAWPRKSGSVRVIYYFMVRPDLIFLADIYAKNEKEHLTHAERNQLQKVASEIQREFGG